MLLRTLALVYLVACAASTATKTKSPYTTLVDDGNKPLPQLVMVLLDGFPPTVFDTDAHADAYPTQVHLREILYQVAGAMSRRKFTVMEAADGLLDMIYPDGSASADAYKIVVDELRRQLKHKQLLEMSLKEWRNLCKQVQRVC